MPKKELRITKDRLKNPRIDTRKINKFILAARKALGKICWELPTKLARTCIPHCAAVTGSGKTLAIAAYGARCACDDNLEHLVYVTPFITLTEQTERVLMQQLHDTCVKVSKTHHKMVYKSKEEQKTARKLGFTINICTSQKLHLCLTENKHHLDAKINLEKSVIIIDDASQYLKPAIASAVLVLLDNLRKKGARIILASASLPHYEKIPGYLPPEIKIHRFAENIGQMPGIKTRCHLDIITRPVCLEHLADLLDKDIHPELVVCETVHKSIKVFEHLQKNLPNATIFLLNAKQAPYRRREILEAIEKEIQKPRRNKKIIVISTSITQAGWDASFGGGAHDIFDVINALEHGGRVNRGLEFGKTRTLHVLNIDIPLVKRNPTVDASRRIAQELMEAGKITDPDAPTIAAKMLLDSQSGQTGKSAQKNSRAAQIGDFKYLQTHLQTMGYSRRGHPLLPPAKEIPGLFNLLKDLLNSMGYRCQILRGEKAGDIQVEEELTDEQIRETLSQCSAVYREFSMDTNPEKFQEIQGQGDILRKIVIIKKNGETIDTGFYMLSPKGFNPKTSLPK